MTINILIIIVLITAGISYKAFSDNGFKEKLMFIPYLCNHERQYYRIFSHVFIHADWGHLIFNMLSLYFLGDGLLNILEGTYTFAHSSDAVHLDGGFIQHYGSFKGQLHFLAIFVLGGLFASLIPYLRHKDHEWYRSLGASGAVSAVIFAAIMWNPGMKLNLMFIPIAIPAYIFGPLYLAYEFYQDKRGNTGIAHDAHIGGAVFGIVYVLMINIGKGKEFFEYVF